MIAATRNESIIAKAMMTRIQELQFVTLSLESVMQYHSIRQEGRKSLTYACMYIHPSESDTISAIATENAPCYIKPPAAVSLGTSAFPCGKTSFLSLTATEMQTGTRGGLLPNNTSEGQPTADENQRSDGARSEVVD